MQIKYMVLAKMHLYTNKWYDIYSVYGANHKLVHQVIWHIEYMMLVTHLYTKWYGQYRVGHLHWL